MTETVEEPTPTVVISPPSPGQGHMAGSSATAGVTIASSIPLEPEMPAEAPIFS